MFSINVSLKCWLSLQLSGNLSPTYFCYWALMENIYHSMLKQQTDELFNHRR